MDDGCGSNFFLEESLLVRFFYYMNIITAIGLIYLFKRAFEVQELGQKFLDQLSKESRDWIELPGITSPRFWQQFLNPFNFPRDCTIFENVPYWTQEERLSAQRNDGHESIFDMALDIYQPYSVEAGDDRPVLFYVHGGGWTMGSKKFVGPLLTEMLSYDWIVVSVDYRRHSKLGYPTQLMDCKRALRWVRNEIRIFGGNPRNIVVAGDAAGGQLACLLSSTANQSEYQPGFEDVDTTVQGVLGLSAVVNLVDLENYSNHDCRIHFIKQVARREDSPESAENLKFLTEHSPRFRLKGPGVPCMMIHGDIDTLTPVQHVRDFVNHFQNTCTAPITYLEVPGGHHCFHLISSPRSWYVTIAASQWLNYHFDGIHNNNNNNNNNNVDTRGVGGGSGRKLQIHEIVEWDWTV
ncbi:Alpha/Beta hydrolase protein [Dissophora ornata]|nr:Alpha/Beta hydrolase protein [Dissophora ornata]